MKEIEYNLRFALSSRTLKILSIDKLTAESNEHFHKKHSGTKQMFSFVSTLATPVKVPVSRPFIDETKTEHELVYCEVAVGNAIYANEAYALSYEPPADFDCFVTQRNGSKIVDLVEFDKKLDVKEDCKSGEKKEELKSRNKKQSGFGWRRDAFKEGEVINKNEANNKNGLFNKKDFARSRDNKNELYKGRELYKNDELSKDRESIINNKDLVKREGSNLCGKSTSESLIKGGATNDTLLQGSVINDSLVKESVINGSLIKGSVINDNLFCIDDCIINNNTMTNNGNILKQLNVNNCYYVINDLTRVNPLYRVRFEYDVKMEGLDDKLCENCCTDQRVCFCHAERAQLCAKCDDLLHFNELTARHRRHYFEDEGTKFLNCGTHSVVIEFWCVNCEEPVCTYCRADTHVGHELINYTHAWTINENMLKSVQKVDEMVVDVKDSIAAFKEDFAVFGLKIQNLKKKIEDEYLKTIKEIDLLYARNCKIIFKDFVEKLAEEERLRKIKEFTPNNFMNFFKVIKQQRNNLLVELTKMEIEPIKVQGGFKINTKDVSKREGVRPREVSD